MNIVSIIRQLSFIILTLFWAWYSNFMLGFLLATDAACTSRYSGYCERNMQSMYDYIHTNHLDLKVIAGYIFSTWLLWQFFKKPPSARKRKKR